MDAALYAEMVVIGLVCIVLFVGGLVAGDAIVARQMKPQPTREVALGWGNLLVFPNMLRQGGSGDGTPGIGGMMGPAFQIRTPIDDNNTAHWWVACYPRLEGEAGQEPEDIPITLSAKVVTDQEVADIYAFLQSVPDAPAASSIPILKP